MARVVKSSSHPPSVVERRGRSLGLPSGSLQVKVYAGLHPVTGRPRYIGETVADGPSAREQAGRPAVADHVELDAGMGLGDLFEEGQEHGVGVSRVAGVGADRPVAISSAANRVVVPWRR
jgi:hypothetical protein